jgi:FkbM family methyltransferase
MDQTEQDGARNDELIRQLTGLSNRITQMIHVQKFATLGPERIIDFPYDDEIIRIHVPYGLDDQIQRKIVQTSTFYEEQILTKFVKLDLLDKGATVFDVGANIGNHTLYFAKVMAAAHVTSFEPQKVSHAILLKNIEINALETVVTPVRTLVGTEDGKGALETHYGSRNLGATMFSENPQGAFDLVSLDSYAAQNAIAQIDFIKIDVEGMQDEVLAGATQVIGDMKPVLWVELREFKNEFANTNATLEKLGYRSRKIGTHEYIFHQR